MDFPQVFSQKPGIEKVLQKDPFIRYTKVHTVESLIFCNMFCPFSLIDILVTIVHRCFNGLLRPFHTKRKRKRKFLSCLSFIFFIFFAGSLILFAFAPTFAWCEYALTNTWGFFSISRCLKFSNHQVAKTKIYRFCFPKLCFLLSTCLIHYDNLSVLTRLLTFLCLSVCPFAPTQQSWVWVWVMALKEC